MSRASHRTELLAPAGDRESLQAALLAGADAVYLGGARFNARAAASNFDEAGLRWARRVTRRLGRRLYVTFNTILFEREWPFVEAELDFLEELGPDAIIVQDLGLLETLHKRGSRLPRHLSTQAAWDGAGGADMLRELGVERVILPRETPWRQLVRLIEESPFEIEMFVHGAHCYSVSGRCHWSVHLGPRSGNRGTCAQPCRRLYELDDAPPAAMFSPKDLRLVGRLPQLAKAGLAAFKLEGRLKNARTVRRMVAAYRAVLDGAASPAQVADDLDLAFSRAWCEGFLDGPPDDWRTTGSVGHLGLRVGECLRPADANGRVLIHAERDLCEGMGLSWNEPGAERDGRRGSVVVWVSGARGRVEARFRGATPSQPGVALYATASATHDDPVRGWDSAWDRVGVSLRFAGREGAVLQCSYDAEGVRGALQTEATLQPSKGSALQEVLRERFQTVGDGFTVEQLDTSGLAAGLFLPPSALKALRRALAECLTTAPVPRESPASAPAPSEPLRLPADWSLRIYQLEHVEDFLRHPAPPLGWVLPLACAPATHGVRDVRYWLPPLFGPDAVESVVSLLQALPGAELLCFSWDALELARRFPQHRFSVDGAFNVSNERAASVLRRAGVGFDAAIECQSEPGASASGALTGAQRVLRLHPLVSISRFPAPSTRRFRNDRGDVFHLHALGEAEGLFLERWPDLLPAGTGPIRVDAFVPPGMNAAALLTRLRDGIPLARP